MVAAILFVSILLLIGITYRQRISLFRWLFIPASVIAGLVGLLIVQCAIALPFEELAASGNRMRELLSDWPGWLISVVFAGMLMQRGGGSTRQRAKRVGKQGLMVWIIVLGETMVGLWATWLLIQPTWEVPNSFGMLIETGFAGGHGTAGAMGEVFAHETIGFSSGRDMGMLMATSGLIYGVVSGILWINLAARWGWIRRPAGRSKQTDSAKNKSGETNAVADNKAPSQASAMGRPRIDRDIVDPLLFQILWLSLAVGVGWSAQQLVLQLAGQLDAWLIEPEAQEAAAKQLSKRLSFSNVMDFPLFIYTMLSGWLVRFTLEKLGQGERLDTATISRLTTSAMEVLVVSAVASLNLSAVADLVGPFLILLATGAAWTAVCLLVVSRWVLPNDCWFPLGLINYGMSTGTTATGFVLLQVVDPEFETSAAEDYALAAPLSAPFIGGGILTVALPLLLLERVSIAWPTLVISGVVISLIVAGRLWNRTGPGTLESSSDSQPTAE